MAPISQAIKTLQGLVVFLLLGIFGYNLYNGIRGLNITVQSFSVETRDRLVPPALTICIEGSTYSFEITVYGKLLAQGNSYLDTYRADSPELSQLKDVFSRCWILSTGDEPIIQNPAPVPNVPDMELTYNRSLDNGSTNSPIYLNIFDPLQKNSQFIFNRFMYLEADVNRAISFSRTQNIGINGTVRNDVRFNIVDEFRDPRWTYSSFAKSRITIRAETFDILKTTDVPRSTPWSIFRESFTLLGVLYSFYLTFSGQGKYKPWGLLHRLLRYYPIEHIKYRGTNEIQENLVTKEREESPSPKIEEKLRIFLDKFDDAKYNT
ncbi:hypothetical protein G9A89_002676 [Geosiphon pyriformis]|nr:hypothetical protein G9A89_002961 [Geosiphon pyriformis]KAG9298188.1 hypothetical protein G9A89_002676 [Geosiphon pyriformis]